MSTRRDREQVDAALDRLAAGLPPQVGRRHEPLIDVARAASAAVAAEVPPDVATRHLTVLFEAAGDLAGRSASPGPVATPPRRRLTERRERAIGVALASLVTVMLLSASAVAASSSALPGDRLYELKLVAERVSLVLEREPAGRAALRVEYAHRRVTELEALLAGGAPISVEEHLRAYESYLALAGEDVTRAGETERQIAAYDRMLEKLDRQIDKLSKLKDKPASPRARESVEKALRGANAAKEKIKGKADRGRGAGRGRRG